MSSIDHPVHSGGEDNVYETIKVLEAWMTRDEMIGFCKGNALKYLSRHREKGGLSDLEKSAWYSRYMVEYLKASEKEERIDELVKLNLEGAKTAKKPDTDWDDAELLEADELLIGEDLGGISNY